MGFVNCEVKDKIAVITINRPEAKKGLATLCIGGGMGCATIVEKYE